MTKENTCGYFAVLDVETNWNNEVMSIGVVVADCETFAAVDKKYYVIYPECRVGGIYSSVLRDINNDLICDCSREQAIDGINKLMSQYGVCDILAYNAPFDYKCLHELHNYVWRDILPIAANRNFNDKLPDNCEYFSTGLLKSGRGLQNVMRLVYFCGFTEQHNALQDSLDELQLMQLVNQPLSAYHPYKPKQQSLSSVRHTYSKPRENGLLNNYCYVIDELCGGAVRLIDFTRTYNSSNGNADKTSFCDVFYLQCSRCGYKWSQEAESFFVDRKCPACGKK